MTKTVAEDYLFYGTMNVSLDLKTHNPTRDSLGLFYIFCDESVVDLDSGKRFLTAHVAVPQKTWNCISESCRDLTKPANISRFERLRKLLEDTNGIAVIAYADVPPSYLPTGERDSTRDIQGMSRTDNIWSVAMAFGIQWTLIWLARHGLLLKDFDFDIYHDTHSMKDGHRQAWTHAITERLASIIGTASGPGHGPHVLRLHDTPKAQIGSKPDEFQAGIEVADRLLEYARDIMKAGDRDRIHVRDNCEHMTEYLSTWETLP